MVVVDVREERQWGTNVISCGYQFGLQGLVVGGCKASKPHSDAAGQAVFNSVSVKVVHDGHWGLTFASLQDTVILSWPVIQTSLSRRSHL